MIEVEPFFDNYKGFDFGYVVNNITENFPEDKTLLKIKFDKHNNSMYVVVSYENQFKKQNKLTEFISCDDGKNNANLDNLIKKIINQINSTK